MLNIATIILMTQPSGGQGGSGMMPLLILMVAMFAILYFFSILPQKKRQKEHKKMIDNLQKGDYVITSSGIYGRIHSKNEKTVTLDIDNGVKLKMDVNVLANKIEENKEL